MEIQQPHRLVRDKFEGNQSEGNCLKHYNYRKEDEQVKRKQQQQPPPASSATAALPPSPSSSPSHEFSFTISLHPSATAAASATSTTTSAAVAAAAITDKSKSLPSIAIDLSPADEIFFHGHLLPLHLLSNLPVSPRTSTHSIDSLNIPKLLENQQNYPNNRKPASSCKTTENIVFEKSTHDEMGNGSTTSSINNDHHEIKIRPKSKSFSLFGLSKWKKGSEDTGKEEKERHKRRLSFDVSHVLKRYVKMVRPLLSFKGRKDNLEQFHRESYPYSGNLGLKGKELRGRRGEYSAPASMRTSPTNSGLLVATGTPNYPSSTTDSTMEELQAAIQAAIAHCKNSINAADEKKKCQEI